MDWYYAEDKQQMGPVSEQAFQDLISSGKVTSETLVWHEGMDSWMPYGGLSPLPKPSLEHVFAQNVKVCSECGLLFPLEEMQQFKNLFACDMCASVITERMPKEIKTVSMAYGSFLARGIAKIIDIIVLSVIMIIVFMVGDAFGLISIDLGNVNSENAQVIARELQEQFLWLQLLINMLYSVFFHGKYGATLGKMACKLKVVCSDGSNISYMLAFKRFFGEVLSRIFLVGYLMAVFDPQKRALHDMFVDTRVIEGE